MSSAGRLELSGVPAKAALAQPSSIVQQPPEGLCHSCVDAWHGACGSAHQLIVSQGILCRDRPVQVLMDCGYSGSINQGCLPASRRASLQVACIVQCLRPALG